MATLKYFFGLDGDRLYLDSVPCEGTPERPQSFLKWYEEGDLDCTIEPFDLAKLAKCELPAFQAAFSPKRITFSVEEAKLRLKQDMKK